MDDLMRAAAIAAGVAFWGVVITVIPYTRERKNGRKTPKSPAEEFRMFCGDVARWARRRFGRR